MPHRRVCREADPLGAPAGEEGASPRCRACFTHNGKPLPELDSAGSVCQTTEPIGGSTQARFELQQPHVRTAGSSEQLKAVESRGDSGLKEDSSSFLHEQQIPHEEENPSRSSVRHRTLDSRCTCDSKACRRSSSSRGAPLCFSSAGVCHPQQHHVFRTVGVHGVPPNVPLRRSTSHLTRDHRRQEEQRRQLQDSFGDAASDAQPGEENGKAGARCKFCGTLRAKAPNGFSFLRGDGSFVGPSRTLAETLDCGGVAGLPGRQLSCEDCGLCATRRGVGPYHLIKQQQQPRQGEVVAGGVQWGHPTSFWLVESERDEGVEREFRRLFRINSPESRIALSSFRLLVTVAVVLAALKYGISTYFPPANQTAFTCFFCADALIWLFFSCEAALRARALGLKRLFRDRQCLFDTFLQLVGLSALALRACILMNVGGLGSRVFDPNPLERTDGIVNDFTIGEVQIALVALDTVQLARIYRLAFSCRELFFLTRSILHSLRSLLWTALFVLVVIYTCAIFCTWAYYDEEDAEMRLLWGNLVLSMFTLFTVLTLEGWNNVATATAEKHPFSRIFFVAYICFTTLTLLNIVTGIILDAYVDMSSRLLKEANYKDDLEKDMRSEKVLLSAFEKTCFLVCLRPAITSTLSAQCTAQSAGSSDQTVEAWGCGYQHASGGAGESTHDCTVPTPLRESETATTWRHAAAGSGVVAPGGGATSQSPRAPMATAGARFERKPTGVPSEDSTARPPTESATDTEPLQFRAHVSDQLRQDSTTFHTCVKYLRIGGHQPMDILRHPIVQDALQVATDEVFVVATKHAFDVLTMYHRRGIQFVTVKEFAEACGRVGGAATGRQLLQVQLELQQKLCAVERDLRTLCRQRQPRHVYNSASKLDAC